MPTGTALSLVGLIVTKRLVVVFAKDIVFHWLFVCWKRSKRKDHTIVFLPSDYIQNYNYIFIATQNNLF